MPRFARPAVFIVLIAVFLIGCGKKPQPAPADDPTKSASPPSDDPALTTDFFPQTGVERHLVRKQFAGDGGVQE